MPIPILYNRPRERKAEQMVERIEQNIGHYSLVQLLGRGNFADVYLGVDSSEQQQVAVKVLQTELTRSQVEQFLAQAEIVARLDHPHIVRVMEYGVEDHCPFLVMQYAPHGSLRQRHPRGTRLPITTIASYVKQIAEALQYVHDRGLIHRDVKPHNMLLGTNYEVMLSDFGIAVVAQNMGHWVQKVKEFEGTILYAAPEQVRGRPRIASYQYALGVVVYEWLCGSWPFHGTVEEIASQHTLIAPPSLCEQVPTISPVVEAAVFNAMAKEPDERFESVQEFAKALERASRLERTGVRSGPPTPYDLSPLSFLPLQATSSEERPATPHVTLLTYTGHSDRIYSLEWSPDGQRIASSSLAESIQVWDAVTGSNSAGHARYDGHTERVLAIAWSPDGRYIASASEDATVRVWDVVSGRSVYTYRGHTLSVIAVAWSPDGLRIASGSEDKTVQVWDAATGRRSYSYTGHIGGVIAVAWSPDGIRMASGGLDETVQVWNAITGSVISTHRGHTDWVGTVAWSPDGRRTASGSWDKTVRVWEV